MAKPLGIGIIGFGRIGAEHAQWINQGKLVRVAGVFDPTPARSAVAAGRGLKVHGTVGDLLSDDDVQAVLIATPTSMHVEHALAALARGRHVMVEKPVALDLESARHLFATAATARRVLSVCHNRRWDLDYLTVARAIRSGTFGRVFNVESRLGQWASCVGPAAPEYRPSWRNEAAFGGGALLDWGSHFLDQIWQLLLPAKPLRLFAQLRNNVWSKDCDDLARVVIDFDNGAAALVEINTTTTRPLPRWHIDGTAGSAFSPFSPDFDTAVWASLRFSPAGTSQHRTLEPASPGMTIADLWDDFATAIETGSPPAVTPHSVLTTMALLDAAQNSARLGQAVALTE
jgi:predicted dehydrogenase